MQVLHQSICMHMFMLVHSCACLFSVNVIHFGYVEVMKSKQSTVQVFVIPITVNNEYYNSGYQDLSRFICKLVSRVLLCHSIICAIAIPRLQIAHNCQRFSFYCTFNHNWTNALNPARINNPLICQSMLNIECYTNDLITGWWIFSIPLIVNRVTVSPHRARSSSWPSTSVAWLRSPGGLVWRSPGFWPPVSSGDTRPSRVNRICSMCLRGRCPHCRQFAFWRWAKLRVSIQFVFCVCAFRTEPQFIDRRAAIAMRHTIARRHDKHKARVRSSSSSSSSVTLSIRLNSSNATNKMATP